MDCRAVITFWSSHSKWRFTCNILTKIYGSATLSFPLWPSVTSSELSSNRCYGLQPFMTALDWFVSYSRTCAFILSNLFFFSNKTFKRQASWGSCKKSCQIFDRIITVDRNTLFFKSAVNPCNEIKSKLEQLTGWRIRNFVLEPLHVISFDKSELCLNITQCFLVQGCALTKIEGSQVLWTCEI